MHAPVGPSTPVAFGPSLTEFLIPYQSHGDSEERLLPSGPLKCLPIPPATRQQIDSHPRRSISTSTPDAAAAGAGVMPSTVSA
jgi:hypothetical protein